jgi:hypothetical protein
MYAHGFSLRMLIGLVRRRLATVQKERVNAGAKPVKVVRIKITDAGRVALESWPSLETNEVARNTDASTCVGSGREVKSKRLTRPGPGPSARLCRGPGTTERARSFGGPPEHSRCGRRWIL